MADLGLLYAFGLDPQSEQGGIPLSANMAMDSSTDGMWIIFQAPVTGPILSHVSMRLGALTGNSPTYVISLQGVAADGTPDGTIKGGASPASVEITPAAGLAGTCPTWALANSYDTSAGEWLAFVLAPKAGTTIDGSNNWSFTYRCSTSVTCWFASKTATIDSGTPTARATALPFGISDGTTWWGEGLYDTSAYATTGSSPAYAGNLFTLPAGMGDTVTCWGAWTPMYQSSAGKTVTASLLNAADGVLAATTWDDDTRLGGSRVFWDDGPIPLTCGTPYRVVWTSADANFRHYYIKAATAAMLDVWAWQRIPVWTQGSPGSWTDTAGKRSLGGIILSGITEPAGGGGFFIPHQYIGFGR